MDNDFDWAAMADMLELEGEAHSPYVRQALDELRDLAPRRVLDVGSGPGVAACRMAEVFPEAEVVAVDGSPELLARAERRAERLGVRLRTRVAEFPEGLADLPRADLVWSGQVVHHVGDQQGALDLLAGLLEPGGVLAIVEGGLPARSLPRDLGFGRPGLQTRLDVAMADRFNRMRAELPGTVSVVEDWAGMLRAAGLTEVRSRSFLVDHPAPLADGPRRAVRQMLERQRGMFAEVLDADDVATLDRLLDPEDPAGVDRRQDLFLLTAKTVHFGVKAKG
ncbi:Ubiquinone/menaquinone biosynthesis C-methylase UbiE [Streptoalloteichus tenebrarius]|uniref:Ubiquinone/menaquinone biosynthesis C-methylase UbiE n=1 Tax=Streptoalloteichus tenebrarius (strain ATCC 17920 / DSM 40477 / JCM 4838 / CBS 697.72 / NBRC 16177 / NCIMB 11028 / NRRL B-12390 / A12253. 1 / ISP 5477) TaxID=1933 RepID=A0ABT1HLT9_STRSD|nr:class I SAM-dependent methyltransferase [Streptoalloteichus tenebrarius]MCP2256484.1 Ubiquinone/menaquinone biosynthesis C-methylase UbiE [Streptoalloteichus tenebrarius]BFF04836.1 class I SAM-dependent methyltransferase [Streptoalloteichus tenebrarius]